MEIAQLMFDSSISANWVMAGLMAILLILMKRNGDKADIREKKIDELLEAQQKQLNSHAIILERHNEKIENFSGDISQSNKDLIEGLFNKIGALDIRRKSRYDKE